MNWLDLAVGNTKRGWARVWILRVLPSRVASKQGVPALGERDTGG